MLTVENQTMLLLNYTTAMVILELHQVSLTVRSLANYTSLKFLSADSFYEGGLAFRRGTKHCFCLWWLSRV